MNPQSLNDVDKALHISIMFDRLIDLRNKIKTVEWLDYASDGQPTQQTPQQVYDDLMLRLKK